MEDYNCRDPPKPEASHGSRPAYTVNSSENWLTRPISDISARDWAVQQFYQTWNGTCAEDVYTQLRTKQEKRMLGLSKWEVARQEQRKKLIQAACKKKTQKRLLENAKGKCNFSAADNSRQPRSSSAHASEGESDGTKEEGGENDEEEGVKKKRRD